MLLLFGTHVCYKVNGKIPTRTVGSPPEAIARLH